MIVIDVGWGFMRSHGVGRVGQEWNTHDLISLYHIIIPKVR